MLTRAKRSGEFAGTFLTIRLRGSAADCGLVGVLTNAALRRPLSAAEAQKYDLFANNPRTRHKLADDLERNCRAREKYIPPNGFLGGINIRAEPGIFQGDWTVNITNVKDARLFR
jgi:hypothetical protein